MTAFPELRERMQLIAWRMACSRVVGVRCVNLSDR